MKNLSKILLTGSVLLSACNSTSKKSAMLKEEDFQQANWIEAEYTGEIYGSYLEENITHGETNWARYVQNVAVKNGAKYSTIAGRPEMTRFKRKTILLPDLDKNEFVRTKLGLYASDTYQKSLQSDKGPQFK